MELTEGEIDAVRALRRNLHRHPELSFEEVRTTKVLREHLEQIPGLTVLDLPVKTGLVCTIEGTGTGPEVALREDCDALPQTEEVDVPWKSENKGVMHACGHDLHSAALFGAAMALSRNRTCFSKVDLIFQPAEEVTRGAAYLMDEGHLFDVIHPAFLFGFHNWPTIPAGTVAVKTGCLMAAKKNLTITVHGRGGHGSEPQNNVDPIVCAAAMIEGLQTIVSRNTDPMDNVVLSVNAIRGGSEKNLVVDDVVFLMTIRALQERAMERAFERTKALLLGTAAAYECTVRLKIEDEVPAVVNPERMTDLAKKIAEKVPDTKVSSCEGVLASEDFSMYRKAVPSSWFFFVGSRPEDRPCGALHSGTFDPDEKAMIDGANLLLSAAATCGEKEA